MRKCELWDMGEFGGNGTLIGFAGTMDEVRAIVQLESGFLCACALGGVKVLPDALATPTPTAESVSVPELRNAFMTMESSSGNYSIVLRFNHREDTYAVHDFLLKLAAKESA